MRNWRSALPALLAMFAGVGGVSRYSHAQASPGTLAVRGVAWDSLRNAPLSGAFVVVAGTAKSAISDTSGRFQFDSLAAGRYVMTLQHDVLDSLGLSGVTARVSVANDRDSIMISTPSFATLWRGACGPGLAPTDSGFLYGTVRESNSKGVVAGATVAVAWMDIGFDKTSGVSQQRVGGKVQTDSTGGYAVCGIPNGVGVQVRATTDSAGSGRVELLLNTLRIRRLDLLMGAFSDADSTRRGFIAGALRNSTGQPVADARVAADGVEEVRSDRNGKFQLRNVPVGTRQLDVVAIGLQPLSTTVDVLARDTTTLSLELLKVTALETVNVTGLSIRNRRRADFEEHKRLGIGKFLDSTVISKRINIVGALLETAHLGIDKGNRIYFPGRAGSKCFPIIWIDKQISDEYTLRLMNLNTIAAIEIYPKPFMIPSEFWARKDMPCGVIAVWSKMYFP